MVVDTEQTAAEFSSCSSSISWWWC